MEPVTSLKWEVLFFWAVVQVHVPYCTPLTLYTVQVLLQCTF